MLGGECLFAAARVAGFIEITRRYEVREQVRRLFRSENRAADSRLLHGSPHIRSVIPHEAGHHGGRIVAVHRLGQIGSGGSAARVYAVALNTALGLKQLLSPARIAGRNGGEYTSRQERGCRHAKVEHCDPPPIWKV